MSMQLTLSAGFCGSRAREWGQSLRGGTSVDATMIAAPASTKNRSRERDPDMHQTKKGKQYYVGM